MFVRPSVLRFPCDHISPAFGGFPCRGIPQARLSDALVLPSKPSTDGRGRTNTLLRRLQPSACATALSNGSANAMGLTAAPLKFRKKNQEHSNQSAPPFTSCLLLLPRSLFSIDRGRKVHQNDLKRLAQIDLAPGAFEH